MINNLVALVLLIGAGTMTILQATAYNAGAILLELAIATALAGRATCSCEVGLAANDRVHGAGATTRTHPMAGGLRCPRIDADAQ